MKEQSVSWLNQSGKDHEQLQATLLHSVHSTHNDCLSLSFKVSTLHFRLRFSLYDFIYVCLSLCFTLSTQPITTSLTVQSVNEGDVCHCHSHRPVKSTGHNVSVTLLHCVLQYPKELHVPLPIPHIVIRFLFLVLLEFYFYWLFQLFKLVQFTFIQLSYLVFWMQH